MHTCSEKLPVATVKVSSGGSDYLTRATPLLAVGVFEERGGGSGSSRSEKRGGGRGDGIGSMLRELDGLLGGRTGAVISSGEFGAGPKEELLLYPTVEGDTSPERVLLLGMGKRVALTAEAVRSFAGRAVRAAGRLGLGSLSLSVEGISSAELSREEVSKAAAEGAVLAAWRYLELKTVPDGDPAPEDRTAINSVALCGGSDEAVQVGAIIAESANLARTLQSRPGNRATPTDLARAAEQVAAEVGLRAEIFDEERLESEGMSAILAVSRGSVEEARLIVLDHQGGDPGDPPLVLVGKGLTFDAGGISLKPSRGMGDMKFDMSGGAAVIAAMRAVGALGVPANVVGIVPSSENLPSSRALKPGDVIPTLLGRTVEVLNTDAEGRLILADAITYASRLKPAAIVDCATLTGAAVVALGHHAAGLFANDDALADEITVAGERSGERCWRMPLWPEYRRQLDSQVADMANIGGRDGAMITAAAFLSEFVGEGISWAHLDIAGTAYGKARGPYLKDGALGAPARLLVEWVMGRSR